MDEVVFNVVLLEKLGIVSFLIVEACDGNSLTQFSYPPSSICDASLEHFPDC